MTDHFRDLAANYAADVTRLKARATELAAYLYLDYRAVRNDPDQMGDLVVELANVSGKRFITRFVKWRWTCEADSTLPMELVAQIASTIEMLSYRDTPDTFEAAEAKIVELGGLEACHKQHMARLSSDARVEASALAREQRARLNLDDLL